MPGYKPAFEFKSKMQASMRSKRTLLVPLFMLADKVMKVKMEVDDTLDRCWAAIVEDDHAEVCFTGIS